MIPVAVIGTEGYAFKQLERIFFLNHYFQVVGVCSEPNRREKGYHLCVERKIDVFEDVKGLLEAVRSKAKAVFIFTGIDSHYQYARQCLENGFEVFLEKPPVPTIQQIDDLIALESQTGRRVAVLFQYLYSGIVRTLKRRIVSGEFGQVRRVRSLAAWQRPDAYFRRNHWCGTVRTFGGEWVLDGTLNNPQAHVLSNSLYLAGPEADQMAYPLVVEAELYRVHEIESEDTSSMRIVCENGCVLIHNTTLCSTSEVRSETVVECERATITYRNFNQAQIVFKDGRQTEFLEEAEDPRMGMLKDVAACFENGRAYKVPLVLCRPFTLCVNGAFDSSGQPADIDPDHVVRSRHNGMPITLIKDIVPIMQRAHASSQLLSEIQVPWARRGRPIVMKEYSSFPGPRVSWES